MVSSLRRVGVQGRSGPETAPRQVFPVFKVITADGGLPAKLNILAI
jgi:hypothetical protein